MQEARAESMDGLHLESTRRLQGERKQPASARTQRWVGLEARYFADLAVESFVVVGDPAAERIEDLLGHIGGCGLGEGDAENFLGRDIGKEEPDHALRQNEGLARSGIGRDPR